jgi:hypothetical protein
MGVTDEFATFASAEEKRKRTITPDFGIDLRGRLGKSHPTSNSFTESSSC